MESLRVVWKLFSTKVTNVHGNYSLNLLEAGRFDHNNTYIITAFYTKQPLYTKCIYNCML